MKNNKVTNWLVTIFGILVILLLLVVIGELKSDDSVEDNIKEEVSSDNGSIDNETTVRSWNTDVKSWTIKTESGEELHFKTPKNFYSLTDQYLDNLANYYNKDSIKSDSMVVVGDAIDPYQSNIVINANKLSGTFDMLKQVSDKELKESDMQDAEAYIYMKTGKLPKDLPLNYKIEEVGKYTVKGVDFVAYEVSYDTEYETDENNEKKEIIHTQQISCYSKTEDSVEIIVYENEYNREDCIKTLEEFLGVK